MIYLETPERTVALIPPQASRWSDDCERSRAGELRIEVLLQPDDDPETLLSAVVPAVLDNHGVLIGPVVVAAE